MKQTMKYLSMAALVVMGAILASCAKNESTEVVEPAIEDNIVVCTTTVSFDTDATKALTEHGVKTFAEGDRIAVIYKNTNEPSETVKAVSEPLPSGSYDHTATFTVELTNPAANSAVRIIYPAAMAAATVATDVAVNDDATINYAALNTQDGTLASLSSNLDLAVYDGNLSDTSLPADPALHNKLAICKYTLKDNAVEPNDITSSITGMSITDGTYKYSVTRSAAAGPIYVAIRPTADATVNYTATNGKVYYTKTVTGKTYAASEIYQLGLRMAASKTIDLAALPANFIAQDGDVLTGTLGGNYKITIASGATVTLAGVNINGDATWTSRGHAGLECYGNATIILKDGTTNTVKGFDQDYPGIFVLSGCTLTIQGETAGTGRLIASSNGCGAGIGGGDGIHCGNIIITGGTVEATGGEKAAGIGGGGDASCGNITISGGTVTATKGADAPYSIGAGYGGSCGTVTIGGVVGAISTSPYTYPVPPGAISSKFSVSSTKQVYFSKGNLQATYDGSAWTWAFATHQWDYIGENVANTSIGSTGTVDLFGWSSSSTYYGISSSTDYYDYSGDFVDWGNSIGPGWHTLSSTEWTYLFGHNTSGWSTVNGNGGYVIRPDDVITAVASSYTDIEWATEEANGSLFLPAAGFRSGNTVISEGEEGYYHSSTPSGEYNKYILFFYVYDLTPADNNLTLNCGMSVRLVFPCTPSL